MTVYFLKCFQVIYENLDSGVNLTEKLRNRTYYYCLEIFQ
jgi:hypothetical protein